MTLIVSRREAAYECLVEFLGDEVDGYAARCPICEAENIGRVVDKPEGGWALDFNPEASYSIETCDHLMPNECTIEVYPLELPIVYFEFGFPWGEGENFIKDPVLTLD